LTASQSLARETARQAGAGGFRYGYVSTAGADDGIGMNRDATHPHGIPVWHMGTREPEEKQLLKINDAVIRKRVYDETQTLADFPNCAGIKRLINHKYSYRLRIGDYRVFFEFDGEVKIVSIEEVKKRNERTY